MKSKLKNLIFVILVMNTISVNAQSLLEEGSEWYYTVNYFAEPGYEYNRCYIEADTIIQDKSCKIYNRTNPNCNLRLEEQEFLLEEDQKIYFFDTMEETFKLLYDFSAEVGDTLVLPLWDGYYSGSVDSVYYIRIDSIDYINYNNENLKRFNVTYDRDYNSIIDFNNDTGTYIEKIGSLTNYFHFYDNGWCDWQYSAPLRCFSIPNSAPIQFIDIECDAVLTATNDLDKYEDQITVFPNPADTEISIHSNVSFQETRLVIFNLQGKQLMNQEVSFLTDQNQKININHLPKGANYFLTVFDLNGQLIYATKIVK